MAIAPYAPCPCGSGKKTKFCCGDLATDIDRVVRMITGDQRIAAMRVLNQLLEKHPDRIALLDLKSGLTMVQGQYEDAEDTIDRILAVQPENPSALARRAILFARANQPHDAVASLQRVVGPLDGEIPHTVLEAFLHVGLCLYKSGHILAAKAHLQVHMHAQPEGSEDHRGISALLELHHYGGLPLLIRDDYTLAPSPADTDWAKDYDQACAAVSNGAWELAATQFERLLSISENAPPVVYSLAVVHGWLGNTRKLVDGLRKFARLDVPEDAAVEALSLANVLDHGHAKDLVDRVRQTYELSDPDQFLEFLSNDQRVSVVPEHVDASEDDGETASPIAQFILLDRPLPTDCDDLTREEVPVVLGLIQVFGRETDRPARLVFNAPRTADWEEVIGQLDAVTASTRGEFQSEESIGTLDRVYAAMSLRLRIPNGVPAKRQVELMRAQQQHAIAQIWPTVPQHALNGRSPDEAAGDPSLRVDLLSAILVFETTSLASGTPLAIHELRERLGVGTPTPIDLATSEFKSWDIPFVRVLRLDLRTIDDDELVRLWRRAKFAGATQVSVYVAREAVTRRTLKDDQFDLFDAYQDMIRFAGDVDEARAVIDEARLATKGRENADATWDVAEFAICLEGGEMDEVGRLLGHLREEHSDNPMVARALHEIFSSHGINLAPASDDRSEPPIPLAEGPATETSDIWTPGSGRSAAIPAEERVSGERPAIWTP